MTRRRTPAGSGDLESTDGAVERITFQAAETGYTVLKMLGDNGELFTAVGAMIGVSEGARLRLHGRWTQHPRYGRQFRVETYAEEVPATTEGIQRYLGSGLVKGVGPATAERIVDHFGAEALTILDESPERLAEVPSVGQVRAAAIADAWREQQAVKQLMIHLQGHGVTAGLAARIYAHYGDTAMAIVQRDPYQLARDIRGVGFLTADRLAQQLGISPESPERIGSGIVYALQRLSDEGHTHPPSALVLATAAELLEISPDLVPAALERMASAREVVVEDRNDGVAVALPALHRAETAAAARVAILAAAEPSDLEEFGSVTWGPLFAAAEAGSPHRLEGGQREGVTMALTSPVSVLTGGPGTGKTTAMRTALQLARDHTVVLAAPTGRAAKRLAEACGAEAKTLHRLLEFDPRSGHFRRDEAHPLEADLVIVDEASMIDILLFSSLVRAVRPGAHLLLVGDADQLPSVGPGNVLADLIASGAVPVVRLTRIFRQSEGSHIVDNAHRINSGDMPTFPADSHDCFMFRIEAAERAAEMLVDVVARRIPEKFNLDPASDIQVLSPMHRGPLGVAALNRRLQEQLNPGAAASGLAIGDRILRPGDRVMQMRNNYDVDIFNGDVGRVVHVDTEKATVEVDFDGSRVVYDRAGCDDLSLAYACSIHKSQGSEFPAVVMALSTGHYLLLQRNLVYTGITRARRLFILVGSGRALSMAVRNTSGTERHTRLDRRLRASVHPITMQGSLGERESMNGVRPRQGT